jgi:hypothetical protein
VCLLLCLSRSISLKLFLYPFCGRESDHFVAGNQSISWQRTSLSRGREPVHYFRRDKIFFRARVRAVLGLGTDPLLFTGCRSILPEKLDHKHFTRPLCSRCSYSLLSFLCVLCAISVVVSKLGSSEEGSGEAYEERLCGAVVSVQSRFSCSVPIGRGKI